MQSEKEFLANYSIDNYARPSVTADIAAFMIRSETDGNYRRDPKNVLSILLVRRGEHPYKDSWALPGGFLRPNETIEQCALREITEETGITPASLLSTGVFSQVDRDPRGRIISHAFASIISEEAVNAVGGDDATDAKWFDIVFTPQTQARCALTLSNAETVLTSVLEQKETRFGKTEFTIIDSGTLAFDHAKIIATALTVLRSEASDFDTIFDFLPEKFTLAALQRVQETITNISTQPANFRRKVASYVVETDEYTTGNRHRPAKLFKKL